eukprot:TRINITY_DN21768_c0_g1_i1.p1 TRINITY_DN21768_c0_g1~~TRINITY_DN21768_c0_g1_i1.p1  ORF type:complete len:510 (+),score=52.41 TRINITY_DN21768_c0_g1_i1:39-1568(+)
MADAIQANVAGAASEAIGRPLPAGGGDSDAATKHRRHAFMRPVLILLFTMLGMFYGFSPLVLPVAERLAAKNREDVEGFAGGVFLYGFTVLFVGVDLVGGVQCMSLPKMPRLRKVCVTAAVTSWPILLVVLAVAVHLASLPLLLVAFLLLSFPLGTIGQYVLHAEVPLAWGDEITKGNSMCGLAIGAGALFWTLMFGEITHMVGSDNIASVIGMSAGCCSVLNGLVLVVYNPGALYPLILNKDDQNGEVTGSPSVKSHRPTRSMLLLLRDWRTHIFVYVLNAFIFCGIAMKMLLSTIFEEALAMSYVNASRMSALCLLVYMPGRGLAPLFASRDRVFRIFFIVLVFETLAYALTPWAVSLGTSGQNSLALVVYTGLRIISGGGFAIMLGNIGVLAVRVFGAEEVPAVVAYWSFTEWVAGCGPSLAWVIHVEGGSGRDSFNVFFFLCAGVAASASICTVLLAYNPRPDLQAKRTSEGMQPGAAGREVAQAVMSEIGSAIPSEEFAGKHAT